MIAKSVVSLGILAIASQAIAWAEPPAPPVPAANAAVQGCRELRFGQTASVTQPGVSASGFSHELNHGLGTSFGAEAGLGYCLTNLVELGFQLGISLVNTSSGTAGSVPFVAFLKLNFGRRTSRWNPFVEAGLGGLALFSSTPGIDNTAVLNMTGRGGVEFFVRPSWALFVSPGVQLLQGFGGNPTTLVYLKVNWGLAAYF